LWQQPAGGTIIIKLVLKECLLKQEAGGTSSGYVSTVFCDASMYIVSRLAQSV
jgi:hypothetical protein